MNILDLLLLYKSESFNYRAFVFGTNEEISKQYKSHFDYFEEYLNYYKSLLKTGRFDLLVERATLSVYEVQLEEKKVFIRHPHSRRIPLETAKKVSIKLIEKIPSLEKAKDFEEVYSIVRDSKVNGFGCLSIYDTTLRISISLGFEPKFVYIHSGAKVGLQELISKGYARFYIDPYCNKIHKSDLTEELKSEKEYIIEDFLCIMKDMFTQLKKRTR